MSPEESGGLGYRVAQLEKVIREQNEKLDEQGKQLAKLEPIPGLLRWAIGLLVPGAIGFAVSVLLLIPK